uniref:Alpha-macroglobulin-like TED domain-containing protein n=1 Tax=Megaselia scalaris TaxID=36166 RepID=T1GP20_MEGSC
MNVKVDIENLSQGGIKDIIVPPKGVKAAHFLFAPTKAEDILLKIQVLTVEGKKKITGLLRVRPEGVTKYVRSSVLMNLKEKFEQSETLIVDIPDSFVPQSESVEILGFADLMGMTIGTTFKLERQVIGCGEWNMADFNHNLLMMRYLSAVKKLGKFIEEITRTNLEDAYQRQLFYKHRDGSFSNFGIADNTGSTWLTATVAKSFYQAQKFTFIDPKLIEQALEYLASMQMESGEFKEMGPNHFPESDDSRLILSSYVILSFLENKKLPAKYHNTVNRGLQFIAERVQGSHEFTPWP